MLSDHAADAGIQQETGLNYSSSLFVPPLSSRTWNKSEDSSSSLFVLQQSCGMEISMKEELIRIENGVFLHDSDLYRFDIEVSKGECIGLFVDDHEYDGTAYEGIFSGGTKILSGKTFALGKRVTQEEMTGWIRNNTVRLNRWRFTAKESNVQDFLLYLGPELDRRQQVLLAGKLRSAEAEQLKQQMGLHFTGKEKLTKLPVTEYYKLAVFRAWLRDFSVLILDRLSEILPSQELDGFMECVQLLQSRGTGCIMLEMNEDFMYQYSSRIDVIQNRRLCYRLEPEEYGEVLYQVLGWNPYREITQNRREQEQQEKEVLRAEGLLFEDSRPLDFVIRRGEIALCRDEHLELLPLLKEAVFEGRDWISGSLTADGKSLTPRELRKKIGREICIQTELPDRRGGVLFENLTGLENLYSLLIPKSGRKLIRKNTVNSILHTAEEEFSRELLMTPVKEWSHPDRLGLIYYRWYLMNPRLLVCMMPFSGQESTLHEKIIAMLVRCAGRGMAVLLISSGVDGIYEKTENQEFRKRLKIL